VCGDRDLLARNLFRGIAIVAPATSFNDDRLLSFDSKDFGQMCGDPSLGGGTLADAIAPLTERLHVRSLPASGEGRCEG
jgi:hypothetical protein